MAFDPSHTVPDTGLPSWAAPDPSQDPVATLDPGLEVVVVERRGQWAQVQASNGWTGWVDGDRLLERAAPEPAAQQTEPQPQPQPEPTTPQPQPTTPAPVVPRPAPEPPTGEALRWGRAASVLLILATLLDWDRPVEFDFAGQNLTGWDFPLWFLFDHELNSTEGVSIGMVLVGVAIIALAFARTAQATLIWRVTGAVALGATVLFLIQTQRFVSDFGEGTFIDFLGPGFYLAAVAGVGLLVAPTRSRATSGGSATSGP